MSKGSTPRPYSVDLNTFNNNWDNIFRKHTPKEVDDQKAEDEAFEQVKTEVKDSQQGG
jgi:hypothetical protein